METGVGVVKSQSRRKKNYFSNCVRWGADLKQCPHCVMTECHLKKNNSNSIRFEKKQSLRR